MATSAVRRALGASLLALAVTAAGMPARGGEPPLPEPVLVRKRAVRAHWYTARVRFPAGASYRLRLYSTIARNKGDGCVDGYLQPDGGVGFGYGFSLGSETRYRRAYVNPQGVDASAPPEVRLVDESYDRPRNAPPRRTGCGGGIRVDEDTTLDLVAYMVSQQTMADPLIELWVSPGARVLAESWGLGATRLLREWDFTDAAVYAGAGELLPPYGAVQARTIVHGTRDIRFRRTPLVYFAAGYAFVPGVLIPYDPTLLSWQRLGTDVPSLQPPPVILAGGNRAATYRFGVEAWGAGWLFAPLVAAGHDPYLFLAAADADFPACSVLRVRSRARDGHPICG